MYFAEAVATRMLMHGSTISAIALGGLEPSLAASALEADILSTRKVAKILSGAKNDIAYQASAPTPSPPVSPLQVLRRMSPEVQGKLLKCLTPSTAGALIAQIPSKDQDELLETAGISAASSAQISSKAQSYKHCRMLLNQPVFMPWRVTHAVLELDSLEAARLLATSAANRSAVVLNNASSINFKDAADRMEVLATMSSNMHYLGANYKAADIKTFHLLVDLARQDSDYAVRAHIRSLMSHFRDAYGVRMTLTSVARQGDEAEAGEGEEAEAGEGEEAEAGEGEEAEAGEGEEVDDEAVDTTDAAKEKEAEDKLDILCSTEDIRWGTLQSPNPDGAAVGMTTQINARELLLAQEEAIAADNPDVVGKVYFKGAMVHMPIMFRGGDGKDVCIGCLSHVIKRAACRYILGGFPSPTVNNVPKALGLMQFLAAALSLAHDRIQ
eukprot:gene4052-5025_t